MGYHNLEVSDVLNTLETSSDGMSEKEVLRRQIIHGLNEIETTSRKNPFIIFLNQFKSFIIYILLFAVFFSVLIGEYLDSLIILAILLTNATIGFFQEYSADKSLEALKRITTINARVIRGQRESIINSKYLVPGDIIRLEAGDKVPADSRLIESHDLDTQEGPLTGESQTISKITEKLPEKTALADHKNMVYASTVITAGRGKAIVTKTGMLSQIGRIAKLISETFETLRSCKTMYSWRHPP